MKKIILLLLTFFFFATPSFAATPDILPQVETVYKKIYIQLDTGKDKGLSNLYMLKNMLDSIADSDQINEKNAPILHQLQMLNNEKIFELEQKYIQETYKTTFDRYPFLRDYRTIYEENHYFLDKNNEWRLIVADNYYEVPEGQIISKGYLAYNSVYPSNAILYLHDGKVSFILEHDSFRLVSDSEIYGMVDKKYILDLLSKYKYRQRKHTYPNESFEKMRATALMITKDAPKKEDKIKAIYQYIIDNTEYKIDYDLENADHFSGVSTFITGSGVCEGYVELFIFMLAYVGIEAELIGGDVIDVPDFGTIGHAWARVGDAYYDPTFDDPVGALETRLEDEYEYYKLPFDLFYTNRFNEGSTPKYLFDLTLEERQKIVRKKLAALYDKYKHKGYKIFGELAFRLENGIDLYKELDVYDLGKATMGVYFSNNLETVTIDGRKKSIVKLDYYELENTNLDALSFMYQFDLDLSDFIMLIDTDKSGEKKFYFANEYVFR